MMRLVLIAVLFTTSCRNGGSPPPQPPEPPQPPPETEPEPSAASQDAQAVAEVEQEPDDTIRLALDLKGPEAKLATLCPKCKTEKKLPAGGPYKSVRILTSQWDSPAPGPMMNTSYALGIQTEDGWFIMDHLGTDGILCGGESLFNVGFDLDALEYRDAIPGDPEEIILTFEGSAHGIFDQEIVVCSIGPSGKPSCGGPWIMSRNHPEFTKSWESLVEFLPDGQMVYKKDGEVVSGPYKLSFP
jgi:hypothetical protein